MSDPQRGIEFAGMKFTKTKFDGLDGKTVVGFTEMSDEATPFSVRMTKSGMTMQGKMSKEICTQDDLEAFARFVTNAWMEREKLRQKLSTTLAGH